MTTIPACREIPEVPGHWLLGNAAAIQKAPHRFPAHIGIEHGGLARFRILHRSFIACASVEAVRHVLVYAHQNYPRSYHHRNAALVIGNGLICTEGETWLTRRRQVLPSFGGETMRRLTTVAVRETNAMLAVWETSRRAGEPVITMHQAHTLTLSVISHALFSRAVEPTDLGQFVKAVRASLRAVRARNVSPVVLPMWVPSAANRQLNTIRTTLDDFMLEHLREREALPPDEWPDDILSQLLRARDPDTGEPLSREALRDELKTLFVAGFETTAGSLTWCLYLLARNRDAAARWHTEVDAVLGGNPPDTESIARLEFTGAVVHEAMRLYPPVYNLGRMALGNDEIAGNRVRRGDVLLLSIFGAHRDPREWKDPERFQPERFLPGQTWNSQAYMPFGVGKHRCIGNIFAMIELMVALSLIGQRYEISVPDDFEVGESAFITLTPDKDIPLTLTPRA